MTPNEIAVPPTPARLFDVPAAHRETAVAVVGELHENESPKLALAAVKATVEMEKTNIAASKAADQPALTMHVCDAIAAVAHVHEMMKHPELIAAIEQQQMEKDRAAMEVRWNRGARADDGPLAAIEAEAKGGKVE